MKKISIHSNKDTVGMSVFDYYYAYRQSLNSNLDEYNIDINLNITSNFNDLDGTKILYQHMPTRIPDNIDAYDKIILCNSGHPLYTSTTTLKTMLERPNAYLLCDAYVTDNHPLKDKLIWFAMDVNNCRDYWSRPFYPQHYNRILNNNLAKKYNMFFISGANRTWRHHITTEILKLIPNMPMLSNITKHGVLHETNDAHWESPDDEKFRVWVNNQYQDLVIRNTVDSYYDNSVTIGYQGKFGKIPPGYFLLNQYFESNCIVFPECTWQNNELNLTEKTLKCFITKTIPWPISGANNNKLINQLGFKTAWNLLPKELQAYDQKSDHCERYKMLAQAVAWAWSHPEIFTSEQANYIREHNYQQFYSHDINLLAMKKLDEILQ